VKLNIRRWKLHVLCCASAAILVAGPTYAVTRNIRLLAAGDKAKVTGSILSRDGDLVRVLDKESGEQVIVNITDSTKMERKKRGIPFFRHADMDVTAMVPGLTIDAEGMGNSKGQLDASKISFTPDELAIEVAQERQLLATKTTAENARSAVAQGVAAASQAESSAQAQDKSDASVATSSKQPSSAYNTSADSYLENTPTTAQNALNQNNANDSSNGNRDDWVHTWFRKVDEARASQPHFVAPIVTTHVMLVEQYRYDMSWQQDRVGGTITANYGASRGLEIIPTTRLEVGIFPPSYLVHQAHSPDGFGDLSFQVKFRAFSATEDKGDYFVGFFLGGSFPTGTPPNGLGHTVLSPTFAVAKGIGPWDIQSTIGANLPTAGTNLLGRTILFNTAVDYRIKGKLWPMLEQNSTFWSGGSLDGKKQVFLTPGLVLGGFPLAARLHLAVGGGLQIAVTPFHQYNHRWILSVRFPF
jgi:hypothetical protein